MPSGVYCRKKDVVYGCFKKGHIPWDKNKENIKMKGENNPAWKGDNVSYRALHIWIRRQLGSPIKCENCGKIKTTPKSIDWANTDHKYERILIKWKSWCKSCHRLYDYKNNTTQ